MKLFLFCLFAVCLGSVATKEAREKRKLHELLFQLNQFTSSLQLSEWEKKMPTPPLNIEDCCSLKALDCFKSNLHVHFKTPHLLVKSLESTLTKKGLTFKATRNATCEDCASHPNEKADEFFRRLKNLIQKGLSL